MATTGKRLSDDAAEKTIRSHESRGNPFYTQKLTAQSPAVEAIQFHHLEMPMSYTAGGLKVPGVRDISKK